MPRQHLIATQQTILENEQLFSEHKKTLTTTRQLTNRLEPYLNLHLRTSCTKNRTFFLKLLKQLEMKIDRAFFHKPLVVLRKWATRSINILNLSRHHFSQFFPFVFPRTMYLIFCLYCYSMHKLLLLLCHSHIHLKICASYRFFWGFNVEKRKNQGKNQDEEV